MTKGREDFIRERRENEDAELRHEYYAPLDLLVMDRVRVSPSPATREVLERCVPELAGELWKDVLAGVSEDAGWPDHASFIAWSGPSDTAGFPWQVFGEHAGGDEDEFESRYERQESCPFDTDMLLVYPHGFVVPGDITHVGRMLGSAVDGEPEFVTAG